MPGAHARLVTRPRSPSEFESEAGSFLSAREADNNLVLGLITGLKAGRTFGPEAPFFAVVYLDGRVVGAAMRTPPLNLIIAAGTEERALRPILDRIESETKELPGMSGPKALVAKAAREWAERHGLRARVAMANRIYRLTTVKPPRPVAGRMRLATRADSELISSWFRAFTIEAQPDPDDSIEHARAAAGYWIDGGALFVWEDGDLVSMAGASGRTPNGIRVSAVYTPPERRRRGYASALVAALSQAQLDSGRRFCFLFTDLANPTSNKIYQDIGYEPVSDVDEYRFARA
jgi:predicted GNAT family acetyltransferase